ncbi:hypothetical protein Lepto7375DRAFT_0528 [Leptolyngbya sp. PCC 7375]|nr:hypothetical protein Lepto7375DRAFT_0528 [Leptolyngbya sp. PCC 7375]
MQSNPFTLALHYIQRHTFRVVTTLVMVVWCVGLTTYTLHLQHSCDPLLPRHSLPDSCKPALPPPEPPSRLEKWTDRLIPDQLPNPISIAWPQIPSGRIVPKRIWQVINHPPDDLPNSTTTEPAPKIPSQPTQTHKAPFNPKQISRNEAMAIVAGSVALIGLAVIEVPIIVATGAGAAIWYAARTIASTAF